MEKMAWDSPKWGQDDFFPTNPDLADILDRTDLDLENFHIFHFVDPTFLDFQVPRFPKFFEEREGHRPTFAQPMLAIFPGAIILGKKALSTPVGHEKSTSHPTPKPGE